MSAIGLGGAVAWQAEAAGPAQPAPVGAGPGGLAVAGPPALAALPAGAAVPTGTALAARLDQIVQGPAGTQIAAAVTDVATGRLVYGRSQTLLMPPASTIKIATAVAALERMPGTTRFATTVVQAPGTDRIVLVGGGDVTLSSNGASPDPDFQPTLLQTLVDQTAAALKAAGRTSVSVGYDDSAFAAPAQAASWSSSYTNGDIAPVHALEVDEGRTDPLSTYSAREPNPALSAAQLFAQRLAADGITVTGAVTATAAPTEATAAAAPGRTTPAGSAKPLARVFSPPLDELIDHMLTVSDDDVAEALGHLTARAAGQPASFTGATTSTAAELQQLGLGPDAVQLYDNSGLSHQDRITPAGLTTLLTQVAGPGHPELRDIVGGLPIAGFTGTLGTRFTGPASAGVGLVRAKTGTLTGVNTEAGLVEDADGRLLAFAVMATGAADAEGQLDQFAAALAGCGCR
ncbi:MAG TPA: D-alanyl-D-alanine carboxypeptidase/D-alanyl-D-alanine-endopeptidase [Actinocrinis sp.]|nr:D-alanyl-D-alanine carboxypeptidase/D-alanyl-D-alanine-endopeptidase [Actinocrinis sp.]